MLIVSEGRERSCASVWAAHVFLIQSHWIKEMSKTWEQSQQLLNPPFPHCYERSTSCVGKGEWEHVCVNVHECIPGLAISMFLTQWVTPYHLQE